MAPVIEVAACGARAGNDQRAQPASPEKEPITPPPAPEAHSEWPSLPVAGD